MIRKSRYDTQLDHFRDMWLLGLVSPEVLQSLG